MNQQRTFLTDLRIWDGHGLIDADTIILQGQQIEALCDKAALSNTESRLTRSMAGATALPGLMDAHVHMVLDPNQSRPPTREETGDPAAMRERAAMMVRAGITTDNLPVSSTPAACSHTQRSSGVSTSRFTGSCPRVIPSRRAAAQVWAKTPGLPQLMP